MAQVIEHLPILAGTRYQKKKKKSLKTPDSESRREGWHREHNPAVTYWYPRASQ
jgi:hypothetical protein